MRRLAIVAVAGCGFQHGQLPGRDEAGVEAGLGDGRPIDVAPDDTAMSTGDAPAPLGCPTSYTLMDNARPNSRYRSVTASTTWAGAETDCEDDALLSATAAHLIVLDTDAERSWAFSINNSDQWVGLTDINTEQTFIPVTDQPAFYVGTVSGNLPAKDCVILNSTGTLSEACSGGHPYLCECDGRAANPNNF